MTDTINTNEEEVSGKEATVPPVHPRISSRCRPCEYTAIMHSRTFCDRLAWYYWNAYLYVQPMRAVIFDTLNMYGAVRQSRGSERGVVRQEHSAPGTIIDFVNLFKMIQFLQMLRQDFSRHIVGITA